MIMRLIAPVCALVFSAAALGAPGADSAAPGQDSKGAAAPAQPEKGAAYGADAAAYKYGFQDIDQDQSGFISRSESSVNPTLEQRWDELDRNRDEQLDESEFSVFEQSETPSR